MKPVISQRVAVQFLPCLNFWKANVKTLNRSLILFFPIVNRLAAILESGGLRSITLAIQKLKRIANRTIFNRDMAGERFRNRNIFGVMKAIFQDGGQKVQFRRKMVKAKFKEHHVGYSETQTNCKSDYNQQRYGR